MWADDIPRRQALTGAQCIATPLEEKESYRWVVTLRQAQEEAKRHPETQIICAADSEADIYELLLEGMREPRTAEWIVHAAQNRALDSGQEPASPG